MKKLISLLLCACLLLSLAVCACAEDPHLTDGIYEETSIGMKTFYRFNEDGTYYGYFFDGSMTEAGTYEILDEPMEYRLPGYDDDSMNAPTAFAPQTIVTTSYQGAVTRMAYDRDTLQDLTIGGMAGYRFMGHRADYEYIPANEEMSIAVFVFYSENLSGNTLTLYHDRTFVDYTGEWGVEGVWEKTGDNIFTLTDEDDNVLVLTVDGSSAVYGGKELKDRIVEEGAPEVMTVFRADEVEVGLPMPVSVRLDGYNDTGAKLIVEIAAIGAEIVVDEGIWTVDSATYYPSVTLNQLGACEIAVNYEGASENGIPTSVTVKGTATGDYQGTESEFVLDAVLEGMVTGVPEAPEAAVRFDLAASDVSVGLPMNVDFHIYGMSDGTCIAAIVSDLFTPMIGTDTVPLDFGTYTVDEAMQIFFTFTGAGDVAGVPDYAGATEAGLPMSAAYKAELTTEAGAFSIDTTVTGTFTG